MAQFSGSGTFILGGGGARVHDIEFGNTGGLRSTGTRAVIRNCGGTIDIQGDNSGLFESAVGETTISGDWCRVVGNNFGGFEDGLVITANDCTVVSNVFQQQGAFSPDMFDALRINGNRNQVTANKFQPAIGDTRSAVNVAGGECNQVVGNDLGDPDDYATDALIDNGSNTQLFWPADATYGDNFTDCGSGS